MAAQHYDFRGNSAYDELSCLLPPPDFSCVDTCNPCEDPCEPKCPPRVRAKDAVCLDDNEWERCFSLYQHVGCEPVRIPAFVYCIALRVRRQGLCRVLTEECPIRADAYGNACFQWSKTFRELPAGYYEADLYVNGKSCYTWLFNKRSCWAGMETKSVAHEDFPCEPPAHCCVGCVPHPDFETELPKGDCEECHGNQCK